MTICCHSPRIVLLSVRPTFADKILNGTKRVELRRVKPSLKPGDIVLLYVSSPVKELRGIFQVEQILTKQPAELWNEVQRDAGVTREQYNTYFCGARVASGIYLHLVTKTVPIKLKELRQRWVNFHPPQGYRYVDSHELALLTECSAAIRDLV